MLRLVTFDLRSANVELFDAYETKVLKLISKYGGRIEMRVRAIDQSSESHLIYFPNSRAYEEYCSDPEREAAQKDWQRCRASSSAVDVRVVMSPAKAQAQ